MSAPTIGTGAATRKPVVVVRTMIWQQLTAALDAVALPEREGRDVNTYDVSWHSRVAAHLIHGRRR
jgi:hypothetical protein